MTSSRCSRSRCCGRSPTPTRSPGSASPRPATCCSTARPAAARPTWSRRSPAPARPTCSRSRAPSCSASGSATASGRYASCSGGAAGGGGAAGCLRGGGARALVFLDEVDALAPTRGQATDGGTTDRVVAALLTELDGVEDLRNVVVIGATNRPDLIDPALLRPGRLERLVYVPPPDGSARAAILRASSKAVPLDESVDLDALGADLDGFSAADCAALIRESALAAMRDSLE